MWTVGLKKSIHPQSSQEVCLALLKITFLMEKINRAFTFQNPTAALLQAAQAGHVVFCVKFWPEELTHSPVALTQGNTLGVVLAEVKPGQTGVNHLLTQIT